MDQWYAVIERASGRAVSFGTEIADPLPAALEAVPIDRQPGAGERWDAVTRTVVAVPKTTIETKRDRLADLRAKGWANLALAEKDEARAIAFDIGAPSPPAA